MSRGAFLLLAAIAWASPAPAQQTMYVKSPETDLRSAPDASGKRVAQLPRGTKLEIKEKKGKWYRVVAQGNSGWVYEFKLSRSAPSGGGDLLAGLGGGGATAREGSTAASIRGLSPTSERYAGRAKIKPAHVEMVKHMETLRVSQADIAAFLRTGKLGEYAGAP